MRDSILQPRALDEWLFILDRTALPVHTGQRERVQRVMSNPNSSIGEISRAISEAPSIALILFREANRTRNSLTEPAHGLDAVIKRLGMQRCISLLSSLMDESRLPIPAELRQAWLIGQHANRHANALFAHKMARLWQEIHWGSLLFFAPLWPLLTRHPQLLKVWEQRVLGNREPAHKVEKELLGVPLIRLCHALAEHWALPQWIIDGYAILGSRRQLVGRALYLSRLHQQPLEQQQRLDAQKDVSHWLGQPANSIVLASGLALASHNAWDNPHCLRWQRLISLYLRQPLDAVQSKVHQTSVEHARYLGLTNLWHPAQALIWPAGSQRFLPARLDPAPARKKTAAPTAANSEAAPKPPQLDLPAWREHARQLISQPTQFRNTLQLLNHYAHLFQFGALSRVLVLSVQASSNALLPVCQLGFDFSLQKPLPDRSNNPVFRHALRHREPLQINEQNYSQIADHLDRNFLDVLNSCHLLLGGIFHKDNPVLLVLADAHGQPLHEESLKAFKASNRYLEQALLQRRNRN